MKRTSIEFTEPNIKRLFGTYDGEGENPERLKEYYLKTSTYRQIKADVPISILVGHKGIGKSSLFRIAINEHAQAGHLPILIQPNDISDLGEKHDSVLLSIRKWKFGLTDIIARKVLTKLGVLDEGITAKIIKVGGRIMSLLTDSILPFKDSKDLTTEQKQQIDRFLKAKKIVVFLDDLDRGWQNRKEGMVMISGLINSIRDMSNENEGLSFKLALRTDVYNAVRREDESSDKFEGYAIWHYYDLNEIFVMLVKRILTFYGDQFDEKVLLNSPQVSLAHNLNGVFAEKFNGKGKWTDVNMYQVLLSLIRNRPRDLVKLCTMAARQAFKEGSNIISTNHIESILFEYSKSIMSDTVAEYRSELPQIERLLYGMKANQKERAASENFVYTTSQLHAKIFNLMQQGRFMFASGLTADQHELGEFLYKINFITARKVMDDGFIKRTHYDQENYLASSFANFGYDWEVHLAYRWVLQADNQTDILPKFGFSQL